MWTWLLLLIPVIAIGVVVWTYQRQAAAREAASAERMKAFFGKAGIEAIANPADAQASATPAPAPPLPHAARQPPPALPGIALRAPLLSVEQLAIYRLLKSALPECEVFPRISLSAFIQPAENLTGFAREAQVRRLADVAVDFLVCDKGMKPLAVVQLGNRIGKAAKTVAFAAACVASADVRWLDLVPEALPGVEDLRALVLDA